MRVNHDNPINHPSSPGWYLTQLCVVQNRIKGAIVSDVITHSSGSIVYKVANMISIICLVVLAFCGARAQVAVEGQCQQTTIEQAFNVEQYLGLWYENQRYPSFFERFGKCNTATYSLNPNGTVNVLNTQVDTRTGEVVTIEGWADLADPESGEGKLNVYFPVSTDNVGKYWILDTDYTSYSVVWSCSQITTTETAQFAWILTREKEPSEETLATIQLVVSVNRLADRFVVTDQTGCPDARLQKAETLARLRLMRKKLADHV